jgi:DNA-binding SARP family transcriptional activator
LQNGIASFQPKKEGEPAVQFRILGPLEVEGPEGIVKLGGAKQRALLALLLVHANEVVPTHRLVEVLWPDDPPADAAKALQVHVSRLRRALGSDDVLQTRPGGYLVRVGAASFDLPMFVERAAEGRALLAAGDAAGARAALASALELWRGAPLAELAAEPFARSEIEGLEERRLAAVEDRIEADLALGAHGAVAAELEALVARHPLRERLRGQLMLALYRSGRQAEALDTYREARRTLVEELGIEPGRPLQELEQAILRQDAALDPPGRAGAGDTRPGRRAAGIFVGREQELAELTAGLEDALVGRGRLFLVGGEGGVGKTRLADELASRAKDLGFRVLWGRSWKDGNAPPYWPWQQALRSLGELPEAGDRFARFDRIVALLRQAGEPVLLVLDDAHAADDPSLELLGDVAGELAELPVLLLATYLDVADIPPALAGLGQHAAHHRLRLRPLGVEEVADFLERVGSTGHPATVHAETGGNPRRIWEHVR